MIFGLAFFGQDTFANASLYDTKVWTEVCKKRDEWVDMPTQSDNWSGLSESGASWNKLVVKESTIKRC